MGYSLTRRLIVSLAASMALFFAAQTWMIGREVTSLSEANVLSRLAHDQEEILAAFSWPENGSPTLEMARMPTIYIRPFSGHYFELLAGGKRLRSRSLWDESLPKAKQAIMRDLPGPANQRLLMLSQSFDWHGKAVSISVAENLSASEENASAFQRNLLLFAAAAIFVLLLLQWWIVRYGLQPLGLMRSQLRALDQGKIAQITMAVPEEVLPLVVELNHLVVLTRQRLQRSRHALGDLAHALKTPLAAVSQMLEMPPDATTLMQIRQRLQRMEERISHELARARTAGRAPGGVWLSVDEDMNDLTRMIALAYPTIALQIKMDIPQTVVIDREDMLEILGNLLENGAKWARSHLCCQIWLQQGKLYIHVEDDGVGLEAEAIARVLDRGERADEAQPGHGLGLAIVQEIVEAYEGSLQLTRSDNMGGLKVVIKLPQP